MNMKSSHQIAFQKPLWIGGDNDMSTGKKFEAVIKNACIEQGVDYTRLKDAGWQGEQTTRRFTSKNICDCILFFKRTLLFAEIKHRNGALRFDEITQLDELKKKWNPEAYIYSGVICQLKGEISFVPTPAIESMQKELGKKSFNSTDADAFGIEVNMIKPQGKRNLRPVVSDLMAQLERQLESGWRDI